MSWSRDCCTQTERCAKQGCVRMPEDLPPPGTETMPGRDEATGAAIEPRNNDKQARSGRVTPTVARPMAGETDQSLAHRNSAKPPTSPDPNPVPQASAPE